MDENTGKEILESVREIAMATHKPFNVVYSRARSPLDRRFLESAIGRQHYRSYLAGKEYDDAFLRASDPVRLAILAADEVHRRGSAACIGRVDADLAYHAFCVAGYQPTARPVKNIASMAFHDSTDAWIIDPWMNISCHFSEYPNMLKIKVVKWDMQQKRIIITKSIKADDVDENDIKYFDAASFAGQMHYAPLIFDDLNRGRMIKSARTALPLE